MGEEVSPYTRSYIFRGLLSNTGQNLFIHHRPVDVYCSFSHHAKIARDSGSLDFTGFQDIDRKLARGLQRVCGRKSTHPKHNSRHHESKITPHVFSIHRPPRRFVTITRRKLIHSADCDRHGSCRKSDGRHQRRRLQSAGVDGAAPLWHHSRLYPKRSMGSRIRAVVEESFL